MTNEELFEILDTRSSVPGPLRGEGAQISHKQWDEMRLLFIDLEDQVLRGNMGLLGSVQRLYSVMREIKREGET